MHENACLYKKMSTITQVLKGFDRSAIGFFFLANADLFHVKDCHHFSRKGTNFSLVIYGSPSIEQLTNLAAK